ncbi:ABC transporter ATP-binding protein [Jejubacter calystegiae]|uniref:ABC transporter ATP-binding protein n=1 Tax=Jejubacter calystegiae TaxID=2579935 RepID=A0A4P8YNX1_9ENTR|nr:ABC transporter ATP-binding protein [Jejubacter calystegiae]QCT21836.1 ABC transporter ATP-binding protein [Jejubacter calystegiae]
MKTEARTAVLRVFWPWIRRQKRLLYGSFIILLLASVIRLLEPWPLAFAIDVVTGDVKDNTLINSVGLNHLTTENLLWICAVGVVAVAVLRAIASYVSTIGMALAGSQVMSGVRQALFAQLLRLPLSFHQRARTGDLTMRLINDIGMMREATVTAIVPLLSSSVVFLGMLSIMLFLNWALTLLILLPMPLLALGMLYSSRKIREVSRTQRKREGELAARSAEFMTGIATIQAMSLEKAATKTFNGSDTRSLQQNVRTKRLSAGLERQVDILIAIVTALVLLLGARSVLAEKMSAGELLIFISYMKNAFRPVREFAKYSGRLAKAITAGERITELLNLKPDIDRQVGLSLASEQARKDIRFERVSFAWWDAKGESEHCILHDLSFCIAGGSSVAITGSSGAGKSTLIQLLLRLYDPYAGKITLGGQDLRDYTAESLRKQIGYLPQESLLFGVTIRENIALGSNGAVSEEEIVAAAKLANAHDFILKLPQGYDTTISERGTSLSGGQRQRIAIARAAIRNSSVLLLDEPGVGLDSENERLITNALTRLMRERTCIIVTHNLSLASRADRILVLDQGRIVEQGDHHTLLGHRGRYFELWNIQKGIAP